MWKRRLKFLDRLEKLINSMNIGFHHYRKRRRGTKERGVKTFLDRAIYIGVFLGPIGILPQIIKIWTEKNATGVSSFTWIGYFVGAIFWVVYGLTHKEKPIVLTNIFIGLEALVIIIGVFLFS